MSVTKFDYETRQKLIEAVSIGATYQIACDYAGIAFKNFRAWILRGEREREQDTEYSKFRKDIKEAGGKAAVGWLQVIENATTKEWTAAAWKLERRHFKSYSANPVVREEMKKFEKDIKKLKRQGKSHGRQTKEVDPESNQTPGSTP